MFQELGDYLVTNHSRHPFIVDNVSYIGNPKPTDSSSSESEINDSQVLEFKHKRRKFGKFHGIYRSYRKNNEGKKFILKYIFKRHLILDQYYNIF